MKRILLLLLFSSLLTMCKSTPVGGNGKPIEEEPLKNEDKKDELYYTEQVKNDFRSVPESGKKKFLEGYKATESQYSILFFTQGFSGEQLTVKNSQGTVYKGSVLTNNKTGLAKNMRIINTENNSIFDQATKKTIYIDTKLASKHKFIYVMKDLSNKEKPYKITYSDLLRPEQ